jgi:hypothetical protein
MTMNKNHFANVQRHKSCNQRKEPAINKCGQHKIWHMTYRIFAPEPISITWYIQHLDSKEVREFGDSCECRHWSMFFFLGKIGWSLANLSVHYYRMLIEEWIIDDGSKDSKEREIIVNICEKCEQTPNHSKPKTVQKHWETNDIRI